MSSKLHILIIAPNYPYPPIDGHKLRNYNFFKTFSSDYVFDFLTFGDPDILENSKKMANQLGPCFEKVEIVRQDTLKEIEPLNTFLKLKNIFFPFELSMGPRYYSKEMAIRVSEKIASSQYNMIFFSGPSMYLYHNKQSNQIPCVVDLIDSPSLLFRSFFEKEKNIKKKLASYISYIWARRYEKIYYSKINDLICISPVDRDYVKKNCPQLKMWIVPNGVDTEYFRSSKNESHVRNTLLFTGVMDYSPNNDSIIDFIKNILPLVREKIPDISLTVAGKNPTPELKSLTSKIPEVKLTGFVQDIRPFFEDAMVYVAPIISGAGLKNKVLEAWAMSKPVVATSMSCYGLDAKDGQNVLIANTPVAFAEKIVTILTNTELAKKLAKNSRQTVEESYSWKNRANMLEKIFTEVIYKHKD